MKKLFIGLLFIATIASLNGFAMDRNSNFTKGEHVIIPTEMTNSWLTKSKMAKVVEFNEYTGMVIVRHFLGMKNYQYPISKVAKTSGCADGVSVCVNDIVGVYGNVYGPYIGKVEGILANNEFLVSISESHLLVRTNIDGLIINGSWK